MFLTRQFIYLLEQSLIAQSDQQGTGRPGSIPDWFRNIFLRHGLLTASGAHLDAYPS
jgi:hypothetical protein